MKRSEIQRTAPLKASPDKTREFLNRGQKSSARSLKRGPYNMSGRKSACEVCGVEIDAGFPSKPRKTCGALKCINEAKSRAKRGDQNPMRRAEVAARAQQALRERRAAIDAEIGIGPRVEVCMRPGCDNAVTGQAAWYCSAGCHYADRRRRGMRRVQPLHRCFVCAAVFAFDGNGQGKCCSLACSGSLGSRRAQVEVVSVIQLRGFKREEFRDEVAECRVVGCGGGVAHQHHVIFRQHVEREHGDRWHPGNALGLCVMHHGEAHGLRRLDVSNLRDENYAFAAELFGVQRAYLYLCRYYVGDDPRLNTLMAEEAA
jgi:hypothetical protein